MIRKGSTIWALILDHSCIGTDINLFLLFCVVLSFSLLFI